MVRGDAALPPGAVGDFGLTFRPILASATGHLGHELQRCLGAPSRYVLLVRWERLEDHTEGFRRSAEYQRWRELLHRFYRPFPEVEHYGEPVLRA